jgi:hypothetical protein
MPSLDKRWFFRIIPICFFVFLPIQMCAASRYTYHVLGNSAGAWPSILSSVGLINGSRDAAGVVVVPLGAEARFEDWAPRVERGALLVVEGNSSLAASFGFRATEKPLVRTQSVEDLRASDLRIIWENPSDLPVFEVPRDASVFARERWQKAPLMAGLRKGRGAVLWLATSVGANGYDRLPYLLQAMSELGFEAPFQSRRLWAFFDSSYRLRADPDYLAEHWRSAGIAALQIAAWHYWERDPQRDEYLKRLIEACHRHAILTYAWVEFPHVSEKFWEDHPEWREKTALQQDAQLDWRKLMNFSNSDVANSVSTGLRELLTAFDWDGVNLAELYFESLEGHDNPARFTPMNRDMRREFQQAEGFDPADLFDNKSPKHWSNNSEGLSRFLNYRAELARRLQEYWIKQIETIRRDRPQLDLVLTHIDDRFDASMREKLGADTSRALPLLKSHDFTFLIEDPATIWNLGPRRYSQIASRYVSATPQPEKLAIDINIVERYQDVYPTKQQTGVELFQLVHMAAEAFPRVALYFENSIARIDWPLLASAGAVVGRVEETGTKVSVEARTSIGFPWSGPALVDGRVWPVANDSHVWLPSGKHVIEPAVQAPALRIRDFNGEIKSARATASGLELSYQSTSRVFALMDQIPKRIEIDGLPVMPRMHDKVLELPRGQHIVSISTIAPSTITPQTVTTHPTSAASASYSDRK